MRDLLFVLGLVFTTGLIFSLPFGNAFLAGIASAHEPVHHVTPLKPWAYFDRIVKRKLRWWWLV